MPTFPIPIFFILFLIFVFIFQHHLHKNMKIENEANDGFWEKEQKSLRVRRKNITEDDILHIDIQTLHFPDVSLSDSDRFLYTRIKENIHRMKDLPMINLIGISNQDIRLQFGTANLPTITTYEENYTGFLKAIASYAKFMAEHNEIEEAIQAYEICVQNGSDYSHHYLALKELYTQKNEIKKIQALDSYLEKLPKSNRFIIEKKLQEDSSSTQK